MKNKKGFIYFTAGLVTGALLFFLLNAMIPQHHEEHPETEEAHESHDHGNESHEEESVVISAEDMESLGISVDTVKAGVLSAYTNLTGEIVPDPDKVLHIVPRFAGIVKEVNKTIGDKVTKDEIIAVIESNESLVTYNVKSSIDGVVLDMHMTPGELIGDENHVVTVADLGTVWAELTVYQKDLVNIKNGKNVSIYTGEDKNPVSGRIFYVSPTLDKHTRTATARVRLNNNSGNWKPGMFITAEIETDKINAANVVTLNAVQNFEGGKTIFVKDHDGFKPQPVTTGRADNKYIEITGGVNSGDVYISKGAFVIKSELLKESFGGGHSH